MPDSREIPRGPVFFARDAPPSFRRRRIFFSWLLAAAALAMIWPVYPFFAGALPRVLGVPLSLAWVVLWLVLMFVALLGLYLGDAREAKAACSAAASATGRAEPKGKA